MRRAPASPQPRQRSQAFGRQNSAPGSSTADLVEKAVDVPFILWDLTTFLEEKGLREAFLFENQGVFEPRVTAKTVLDLRALYLLDAAQVSRLPRVTDPNLVAGCMLQYYRELTDPLLTFELWDDWKCCAGSSNPAVVETPQQTHTVTFILLCLTVIKEGVRMRMIKGLIAALPATNRRCFLYLLILIWKVSRPLIISFLTVHSHR